MVTFDKILVQEAFESQKRKIDHFRSNSKAEVGLFQKWVESV